VIYAPPIQILETRHFRSCCVQLNVTSVEEASCYGANCFVVWGYGGSIRGCGGSVVKGTVPRKSL
jgi:ribosomal protein L35AE/L33A